MIYAKTDWNNETLLDWDMIYAKTDWNNETLLDWDYDTME